MWNAIVIISSHLRSRRMAQLSQQQVMQSNPLKFVEKEKNGRADRKSLIINRTRSGDIMADVAMATGAGVGVKLPESLAKLKIKRTASQEEGGQEIAVATKQRMCMSAKEKTELLQKHDYNIK